MNANARAWSASLRATEKGSSLPGDLILEAPSAPWTREGARRGSRGVQAAHAGPPRTLATAKSRGRRPEERHPGRSTNLARGSDLRAHAAVLAALGRLALRPFDDAFSTLAVPYFAAKARIIEGRRGLRLSLSVALRQVYFTAVEPLPVFALIAVVVSAVLLIAGSRLMEPQGLAPMLPALMAPLLVRELIPLLVGLVLVARTGTAVTAEIGTLRLTHELEALEVAGVNIDAFVVLPRLVGLTAGGAALVLVTGLIGLVGGTFLAENFPRVARVVSLERLLEALSAASVATTALKGASFGFLVACIACRHGLGVRGSAREIPVAGARTTLQATLLCLVVDALFTLGSFGS